MCYDGLFTICWLWRAAHSVWVGLVHAWHNALLVSGNLHLLLIKKFCHYFFKYYSSFISLSLSGSPIRHNLELFILSFICLNSSSNYHFLIYLYNSLSYIFHYNNFQFNSIYSAAKFTNFKNFSNYFSHFKKVYLLLWCLILCQLV